MSIIKDLISGGLKGLGDTAKGIIQQVAENKLGKAEAELAIDQEVNRHEEALRNQILKEKELDNADRASARTREAEFVKNTGHADYFQYFIGGTAVLTMVGIIIFILNKTIPDKNDHVVMLVIGELLGIVTAIYGFHYGSSQGSRLKDKNNSAK